MDVFGPPSPADYARAAKQLEDGADVLEKDGWYQGSYAPSPSSDPANHGEPITGKPRCALGALETDLRWNNTLQDWDGFTVANGLAKELLAGAAGLPGYEAVPEWNDSRGRTKQEVLDALRRAAKTAGVLAEEAPVCPDCTPESRCDAHWCCAACDRVVEESV